MEDILGMAQIPWYASSFMISTGSLIVQGDIIYLKVLGNEMIVLNSIDDVRELFDKKGASNSNRPRGVFATEMSVNSVSLLITTLTSCLT